MNPLEIIERSKRAYAECDSYSDNGTYRETEADGQYLSQKFQTRFIRPRQFFFDWSNYFALDEYTRYSKMHNVVWSNGGKSVTLTDSDEEPVFRKSLLIAIRSVFSHGTP